MPTRQQQQHTRLVLLPLLLSRMLLLSRSIAVTSKRELRRRLVATTSQFPFMSSLFGGNILPHNKILKILQEHRGDSTSIPRVQTHVAAEGGPLGQQPHGTGT